MGREGGACGKRTGVRYWGMALSPAWSQAVPDDEIAAEFAAALPEEEREEALRALRVVAAPGQPTPPPASGSGGGAGRRTRDLGEAGRLVRPVTLAREQTLPVAPALARLLPWDGGLARGVTVAVGSRGASASGATSLALALAAEASVAGSWVAVVGLSALGLAAAAELGVALERLAVVAEPGPEAWPAAVAALIGAFDVVLVGRPSYVRAGTARRLATRARERGTVLVEVATPAGGHAGAGVVPSGAGGPGGSGAGRVVRSPFEADLRLAVTATRWHGVGDGHGTLRARQVTVEAGGRRGADRPRRLDLWLLDPDGHLTVVDAAPATVAPRTPPAVVPGGVVDEVAAARRERRRALARAPLDTGGSEPDLAVPDVLGAG